MKTFQRLLLKTYDGDMKRNPGVGDIERVRAIRYKIAKNKERIAQIEEDLSILRGQVSEVISIQKTLQSER